MTAPEPDPRSTLAGYWFTASTRSDWYLNCAPSRSQVIETEDDDEAPPEEQPHG